VPNERNEPPAGDRAEPPPASEPASALAEESPPEALRPVPSARAARSAAPLSLAALLLLVIGGVALSPFWAPAMAPLLPWGPRPATEDYDALAARLRALEQRPAPQVIDVDAVKSAQAALAQRAAALEAAVTTLRQNQEESSATKASLAQLTQRLDKIEAQSASSAVAQTAEIEKFRQDLAQRGAAANSLAERLTALEHQVQTQGSADRTGSVLLLSLLQMREAVEEPRPFPAEYAAFKALSARDPDLTKAAEPLADAARDGVASRTVLRQRLADLAGEIATAKTPATKPKWWEQALGRLRGLVTIRHIDAVKTGPEALVDAAQADLARGDLGGAVAAIERLGGATEAAQPWLRMARQRLAAETALAHLQELLTARLGSAPAVPSPTPPPGPAQPPAMPKTPS
jgi:hypothetical protein